MTPSRKNIAVIGGGIAGMESAINLSLLGFNVVLIEKTGQLGGHVAKWDHIFPNQRPASEIIEPLILKVNQLAKIMLNTQVEKIEKIESGFSLIYPDGKIEADAVVMATGFNEFNARRKEEYGYGIYDNVITSIDLEKKFREESVFVNTRGKIPAKVAIIHCVGSRDEKVGNAYCSKVCCITAVKQAIEIKQKSPKTEVFCFYMDLRMFNLSYEDLYKKAQLEYGVQFIRGRLSEAFESPEGEVILKVEDTLSSKPMKLTVDMVILMVGMESPDNTSLVKSSGIETGNHGFISVADEHLNITTTSVAGIFVAGTASGPANISETIAQSKALSLAIAQKLNSK